MKRSLILASTVAVLGFMALSFPALAEGTQVDCASCANPVVSQSVQMAQLGPVRAENAQTAVRPRPDNDPKDYSPIRTCCDPALATITGGSQFGLDTQPGAPFSANYGWNFLPTPAFSNAMNNTAFIANVMAGYTNSLLVLVGDLKTDNNAVAGSNANWSAAALPATWADPTFTTYLPAPFTLLGIWDSPAPNVLNTNWASTNPYTRSVVAPNHMRTDGTRYVAKLTYWLFFRVPGTDIWEKRQVICNNARDMYVGTRINASGMRVAPGGQIGEFLSGSAPAADNANARMSLGAPQLVTPEELSKIPAQLRNR